MRLAKRPVCWTLGLVLAIELVVLFRLQGPAAKDAAAPLEEFSAARAVAMLQRILGDESPHPSGSAANDRVRERLVGELQRLGLVVELHRSKLTIANKTLTLCNVLVHLPNTPEIGRPLVLATHYDSVAAGPGAADAGACVAALLETARALQHGGPYRHPVYLLITDGEELRLKGAAAFVREHPLAREKPFVLNFDARGSSGPSLMYQTHVGNLSTVRWMARDLPRPCLTGSSYVTVYRYLRRDTDFSVFSHDGWTGLNFAFIDSAHNYHTAQDTLANLDWRSVQHHGENALQLTKLFAGLDDVELQASAEDAVFFDVLGTFVVWFPQRWAWPLSGVGFVVLAICMVTRLGWHVGVRSVLLTLLMQVTAVGLSLLLGWMLARTLVASGLMPRPHVIHGRWLAALYWPLSLAILAFTARIVYRRISRPDVWTAYWFVSSIASLAIAWWVPGFCYLWLVPVLAVAILAAIPVSAEIRLVLSVAVTAVMLLPMANMLPIVFGPRAGALLCTAYTFVLSALIPFFVADAQPPQSTLNALADNAPHDR
ncbi:MAG: M28 family peptidase [Pirellulaceae bacterium]